MNTNMDMSDAHGGAVEEEEAHWVGTVRTSLAIAGNVDAGESQVLFRPCKGQANSKGGWNNNQSPQPAKKEDKCANDADANADANVDANANDDDDDKASSRIRAPSRIRTNCCSSLDRYPPPLMRKQRSGR